MDIDRAMCMYIEGEGGGEREKERENHLYIYTYIYICRYGTRRRDACGTRRASRGYLGYISI